MDDQPGRQRATRGAALFVEGGERGPYTQFRAQFRYRGPRGWGGGRRGDFQTGGPASSVEEVRRSRRLTLEQTAVSTSARHHWVIVVGHIPAPSSATGGLYVDVARRAELPH